MATLVVNNPGYTRTERSVIDKAFSLLGKISKTNKSRHISLLEYKGWFVAHGLNNEKAFNAYSFGYIHQSIHSEWDAVRRFLRKNCIADLQKMSLYNVRITRHNEIKNSRPCRRCQSYLLTFPPKRIFFSTDEGRFQQWLS